MKTLPNEKALLTKKKRPRGGDTKKTFFPLDQEVKTSEIIIPLSVSFNMLFRSVVFRVVFVSLAAS